MLKQLCHCITLLHADACSGPYVYRMEEGNRDTLCCEAPGDKQYLTTGIAALELALLNVRTEWKA